MYPRTNRIVSMKHKGKDVDSIEGTKANIEGIIRSVITNTEYKSPGHCARMKSYIRDLWNVNELCAVGIS